MELRMSGAEFRALRKRHGLGRRAFAERLGLKSRNTIWRYETDQRAIPNTIIQLAILHFGDIQTRRTLTGAIRKLNLHS